MKLFFQENWKVHLMIPNIFLREFLNIFHKFYRIRRYVQLVQLESAWKQVSVIMCDYFWKKTLRRNVLLFYLKHEHDFVYDLIHV